MAAIQDNTVYEIRVIENPMLTEPTHENAATGPVQRETPGDVETAQPEVKDDLVGGDTTRLDAQEWTPSEETEDVTNKPLGWMDTSKQDLPTYTRFERRIGADPAFLASLLPSTDEGR